MLYEHAETLIEPLVSDYLPVLELLSGNAGYGAVRKPAFCRCSGDDETRKILGRYKASQRPLLSDTGVKLRVVGFHLWLDGHGALYDSHNENNE